MPVCLPQLPDTDSSRQNKSVGILAEFYQSKLLVAVLATTACH
jgi:hypothetical protein